MTSRRKHHLKNFGRMSFKEQLDSLNTIDYSSRWKRRGDDPTVQLSEYICLTCTLHSHWVVSFFPQDLFQRASKFHKRIWWISWVAGLFVEKIKLAPVGSTVRYEMMKLCTGSAKDSSGWYLVVLRQYKAAPVGQWMNFWVTFCICNTHYTMECCLR